MLVEKLSNAKMPVGEKKLGKKRAGGWGSIDERVCLLLCHRPCRKGSDMKKKAEMLESVVLGYCITRSREAPESGKRAVNVSSKRPG